MPRRPPHFKAFTTVKNHRKMPGVYQDDALLAMWLRIGWMAIERFANRTEDSFLCSGLDLLHLAGLDAGVANARRKLARLEQHSPIRIERADVSGPCLARVWPASGPSPATPSRDPARWRLTFPNFAKKHGFKEGNGAKTGYYADADADIREEKSQGGVEEGQEETGSEVPGALKPNREPHYPDPTAPQGFEVPAKNPAGNPTQSPVKSPRRERVPRGTPSPESEAAFDLLLWAIDQSMPGASIPDAGSARWRRWCQELDRLHRYGERGGSLGFPWPDIEAVIRWLPTHHGSGDFRWGLVVRSASKLRHHFARLLAELKAAQKPVARAGGWREVGKQVHQSIMETGDG